MSIYHYQLIYVVRGYLIKFIKFDRDSVKTIRIRKRTIVPTKTAPIRNNYIFRCTYGRYIYVC